LAAPALCRLTNRILQDPDVGPWAKFQATVECRIMRLLGCFRYTFNTKYEFSVNELEQILHTCAGLLLKEPMLLELSFPPDGIYVVGDLNADLFQLCAIFEEFGLPPDTFYLFLGDYMDGINEFCQIELLLLLVQNERLFFAFNMLFDVMPIAAIVGDRYLCCHSGVSQYMISREIINTIKRPTYRTRMSLLNAVLLTDILHGCPDASLGYDRPFAASSHKPMGYRFNRSGLRLALKALGGLHCLIRSHTQAAGGLKDDFGDGSCFTFNTCGGNITNDNRLRLEEQKDPREPHFFQNKYCILLRRDHKPQAIKLSSERPLVGSGRSSFQNLMMEKFQSPFDYEDRFPDIQECRFCNAKIPWNAFKRQRCVGHQELYQWIRKNFGNSVIERKWQRDEPLRWYRGATLFPALHDRKLREQYLQETFSSRLFMGRRQSAERATVHGDEEDEQEVEEEDEEDERERVTTPIR
ncbi:unnamed protein product, partial [Gongylonema pulchrum]|uniref:SER_THR_PHOSPHATASE domain-containing protein n=1 Tax=Gongylonema pulchrum TaxID=637853 RepID=A0A183CX87_9BILA